MSIRTAMMAMIGLEAILGGLGSSGGSIHSGGSLLTKRNSEQYKERKNRRKMMKQSRKRNRK